MEISLSVFVVNSASLASICSLCAFWRDANSLGRRQLCLHSGQLLGMDFKSTLPSLTDHLRDLLMLLVVQERHGWSRLSAKVYSDE